VTAVSRGFLVVVRRFVDGKEWQDEDLLLLLSDSESVESDDPELLSEEESSDPDEDPESLSLAESESYTQLEILIIIYFNFSA